MTVSLGLMKKEAALLKNRNNISEIYNEYWEMIKYQTVYPDHIVDHEKYKYNSKEILKKWNIGSQNELIFLLSEHANRNSLGVCKYCHIEAFEFRIRGGMSNTDCEHIGLCKDCFIPIIKNNSFQSTFCWKCHSKYPEEIRPVVKLTEEEELQQFYNWTFDYLVFQWDAKTIFEQSNKKEIQWAIELLKDRIKYLKPFLKVMEI